jgi:hypothetical protein
MYTKIIQKTGNYNRKSVPNCFKMKVLTTTATGQVMINSSVVLRNLVENTNEYVTGQYYELLCVTENNVHSVANVCLQRCGVSEVRHYNLQRHVVLQCKQIYLVHPGPKSCQI